jgi:Lambda phage tail tape-measure protein (Tape_meas_lam_C)
MSEVIGRGVIEVSADSSKMNAAIGEARKSIASLGEASKNASQSSARSIDKYVQSLQTHNATLGKSVRETELYKLALRGASDEQLRAANNALKLSAAYETGGRIGDYVKSKLRDLSVVALASAGGIAALVFSSINAADKLNDLSKSTNLSVEDLSGLSLASQQSGSDLDAVADSISKLALNMGKNAEKFRALGITAKDPLEAFKQLADVFVQIKDPQLQAAFASEALGKSWKTVAPLLAEGGKNIGEMVEKGKRLSGVTKDMADNADKFNDNLAELKTISAGIGTKLAEEMLPAFVKITGAIKLAYEESGKLSALWVGLGGIGAFLFTDEFASATVKIKDLKSELEPLEFALDGLAKNGGDGFFNALLFGTKSDLEEKIKRIKSEISTLEISIAPKIVQKESAAEIAAKAKSSASAEKKAATFIKKGTDPEDKEAKSRRDLELAQIKSSADAEIAISANAEKLLDAQRSAGFISESDYYNKKLSLINRNKDAQQQALESELAALEKVTATGAAKDENDKKIIETQSKLHKLNVDYLGSLDLISLKFEELKNKGDWTKGLSGAVKDFQEQAADVAGNTKAMFSSAFDGLTTGISSSISKAIVYGEDLGKSLENVALNIADAFIAAFIKIQIQRAFIDNTANAEMMAVITGQTTAQVAAINAVGVAQTAVMTGMAAERLAIGLAEGQLYLAAMTGQAQAMVAMAGLNTFASISAVPVTGPAAAPAAAAAAIAAAEGFAAGVIAAATTGSIRSARDGYDIPSGVNPITQLHENEMVLPAPQANVIRDLAKGGGAVGGSQIIDNRTINIDSRSDRLSIMNDINRMIENGNARLVDSMQRRRMI